MVFFVNFIVFVFGLIVGSFLNCLIYRLETGGSLLKSRSFCPHCKHILAWQDLIPVFSFIFLKRKCRYCHQKISWQYPIVEISTAVIFLQIFNFQFSISNQLPIFNFQPISILSQFIAILYLFIISSFLIIIFVYDLKHYLIPDAVVYPAIVIAFLYQLFKILNFEFILKFGFWNLDFKALLNPLFSAILASVFFLAIVLISKGRWMGVGDIKLAFLMGLILGWPVILVALFLAFFIGALVGMGLIIFNKKTLKSEIPFGPFLVTGTFLALFLGNELIDWYMRIFLVE